MAKPKNGWREELRKAQQDPEVMKVVDEFIKATTTPSKLKDVGMIRSSK